jgi:hypothetical protein
MRNAIVAILGVGLSGLLVGGVMTTARFMGPREMNPSRPWPPNFQRTLAARRQAPFFLAMGLVGLIVGLIGMLVAASR